VICEEHRRRSHRCAQERVSPPTSVVYVGSPLGSGA
jgi:hypothetical protein